MYPQSLKNLIEAFKLLPGIGEKTAERLAFSILDLEEENVEFFSEELKKAKHNIKNCSICNSLTENKICDICSDQTRNDNILCVVEDPKNVIIFEKTGLFHGKYHVLNGLISPLDGINPEDIGLNKLIERIKTENFKEIIIAVKPSIEGETTALYIKSVLEGLDIIVSRIASGVPIGADMEYIDVMTLERALQDRIKME